MLSNFVGQSITDKIDGKLVQTIAKDNRSSLSCEYILVLFGITVPILIANQLLKISQQKTWLSVLLKQWVPH